MAIKDQTMTIMKFTDARAHLSELFNRVAKQETRILVEKNGVPVGAIISPRDLERFEEMEREKREKVLAAINDFGNAFRDVPNDEFEREIASAIEESRVELRAEKALAALGGVFKSAEDSNRAYAKALAVAKRQLHVEPERANRE